ncbi:MAG: SDR family oxidoreductase [Cytophagales bacterium]
MYDRPFHKKALNNYSFLVTGGAGFIGSNIVEYLIKYKTGKITVLDNFATGFRKNLAPFESSHNLEIIDGDICDYKLCLDLTKNVDFVLHQAALGSVPRSIDDPIASNKANVTGFLNLLNASRINEVKRFVYAASSSTYGDHQALPKIEENIGAPLSPYAVTKLVNELYASVFYKSYDFSSVGLRYFNVFGPRQDPKGAYAAVIPLFMDAFYEQKSPKINGKGDQTRDFTFVENAVEANIKACFSDRIQGAEVFNVACAERTSVLGMFEMLKEITNTDMEPIFGPTRKGDVKDSLADISKAKKMLDYNPQINILEGLRMTWEWFKTNRSFIEKRI